MALRDQPYLPLFIKDFMTDEKLMECSASATGVYIRTMCVMHKSEQYGTILLKQKDKQTDKQILNFALKLVKHLPYTTEVIYDGLVELVENNVLQIDGDLLMQKRMIKDNSLSDKRSQSGSKGGKKTASKFANDFAEAKNEANTVIAIVNENVNEDVLKGGAGGKQDHSVLEQEEANQAYEFLYRLGRKDITHEDIFNYWQAFILHKQDYHIESRGRQMQHFRDWLKFRKKEDGTNQRTSKRNLGNSAGFALLAELTNDLDRTGT